MTEAQNRLVRSQFGATAAAYVASAGHATGDDLERLLAWGRAVGPRHVLDVATGGGHTALAFARIAARVTACDLTEAMLAAARGLAGERGAGNVRFVAADVAVLPFPDATFDAVTCRIAPHHFADVAAAVREVRRVLRPGGAFLLQDILGHDDPDAAAFILEVERRRDPSHVRAYRAVEWRAFLKAAGLTVMEEAVVAKARPWAEWTRRMRMTDAARRALEGYVRNAPAACRVAFDFRLTAEGVEAFTDRMLLIRAERD